MAIDTGLTLLGHIVQDMTVFNITWVLSLVATFLTLLIITRDVNKWKELLFPVMTGWYIAGLPPFFLLFIFAAIMYGIETLSIQLIGQVVNAIQFTRQPTETEKVRKHVARKELSRRIGYQMRSDEEGEPIPTKELGEIIESRRGRTRYEQKVINRERIPRLYGKAKSLVRRAARATVKIKGNNNKE